MSKNCNENLKKTLELSQELLKLADLADADRDDIGCGVLYGAVRDSAYKIKRLAESEIAEHKRTKQKLLEQEILNINDTIQGNVGRDLHDSLLQQLT